jgi:hypothetical protein
MHLAFLIYGERRAVEKTLREMEAQKYKLALKEGGFVWLEGQVRELPFGIKEIIFPKEYKDAVLSTIGKEAEGHYIGDFKKTLLRNLVGYKKIKKFNIVNPFLWQTENTAIITLGIKEDGEIYDEKLKKTHEAL